MTADRQTRFQADLSQIALQLARSFLVRHGFHQIHLRMGIGERQMSSASPFVSRTEDLRSEMERDSNHAWVLSIQRFNAL